MENTFFPEDIILVNKLIYGPKLPASPFEISWVNLFFSLSEKARNRIEDQWWSYKRLSGTNTISQGDIIVFQMSRSFFMVKRCVALPGDTLILNIGEVYTNNSKYPSPLTIKNQYFIKPANKQNFLQQLDSIGLVGQVHIRDNDSEYFQGMISFEAYKRLRTLSNVNLIEKELDTFNIENKLFAKIKDSMWTLDHMGPFIIPKKGMKIKFDAFNYMIYKNTINKYENVKFTRRNNKYFINGNNVNFYIFKQDYFFVMGDNRKNSSDSRQFGFLPETSIVGKVEYILCSDYEGKFRFDRLLKKVY